MNTVATTGTPQAAISSGLRVLWLLNHTTLRRFEICQLAALGITEIFTPKRFPYDEGNLSASIEYGLDAGLSITQGDLAILNAQDWYGTPSDEAWRIANQHFDIAVIGFFPKQIDATSRHFDGAIVLRVFGLAKGHSYTRLLESELGPASLLRLRDLGSRFWFGAGYDNLAAEEGPLLRRRNCFLPVGLEAEHRPDAWNGGDKRIFFVCPRIGTSQYFARIYAEFKESFAGIPYLIGGAQPLPVDDPHVLGFVPGDVHERNMRELRVMFYHGTEPTHVHYHPFEAVSRGMPLVFMGGGMLDRLGGTGLPGRCRNIAEARRKIQRILDDDRDLIDAIRTTQARLLEPMQSRNCEGPWRQGFQRIVGELEAVRRQHRQAPGRPKRLAVILPIGYRGGSLRGAKLLAEALHKGSRQWGEPAEILFLHLDDPDTYQDQDFDDLPAGVRRRPFAWQTLSAAEARRAMRYAGHEGWEPGVWRYMAPNDGIAGLNDCDAWIVVSDRLPRPLLPLKPYLLMVYDYLQRYVDILPRDADLPFLNAGRHAARVMVTTEFARQDALQYAGLAEERVVKVPMLAPDFLGIGRHGTDDGKTYFVWTTNAAPHKNHENALNALRIYYEELNGSLDCHVTGVNSAGLLTTPPKHLARASASFKASGALQQRVHWQGELDDADYRRTLTGAAFLWHAGSVDNGTFSVVEAAALGVPALSSDYPAMREMDAQFSLNLGWMDASRPRDMASMLKAMESSWMARSAGLPGRDVLAGQSVDRLAGEYWRVVRECL
jgi:glycosyltransferase involved in cell wall biosynthesis